MIRSSDLSHGKRQLRQQVTGNRHDLQMTLIHYRPKRSFDQGNIFTPVCHSVHRGVSEIWGVSEIFGGVSEIFFWGGDLHRNMVNIWPVRILLECILVHH